MGIPGFYGRLIVPNFSNCITKDKPKRITTLLIDFASVAHQVVNFLNLFTEAWNLDDYFKALEELLFEILKILSPQLRLIICIDGLAPLGKINQQRKRRFRYILEQHNDFDSNQISPGTEFSKRLEYELKRIIEKRRAELPSEVIFSGHLIRGEGEHKIVNFIKTIKDPSEIIVILGLDADLILLTLPLVENRKILLYRFNPHINEKAVQNMIERKGMERKTAERSSYDYSIKRMFEYLDIKALHHELINRQIGVDEFILASFLLGSDFSPFLAGFNLISDLEKAFLENLKNRSFANPFNLEKFQDFLRELEPLQEQLFLKLKGVESLKNQNEIVEYPTSLKTLSEWDERLTFSNKIPDANKDIKIYSRNYIVSLIWCFNYYRNQFSVNWEWVYYPYWAPLISDLLKLTQNKIQNEMDFAISRTNYRLDILGQMLLILPRSYKAPNNILPEELQIFQTKKSPIFDFYPSEFEILRDGVLRKNEGFAFLPPFDYERFLYVFEFLEMSKKKRQTFQEQPIFKSIFQLLPSENKIAYFEKVEKTKIPEITEKGKYHQKISQLFGISFLENIIPKQRLFPQIIPVEEIRPKINLIPVFIRKEF